MSKYSKFVFLLLAVVLSFGTTGKDIFEEMLQASQPLQEVPCEQSASSITDQKLNKIFGLHQQAGKLVNPVSSFPAPDSKTHSIPGLHAFFSLEKSIQTVVLQYLLHAGEISRSLTVGDIIFPFHYFW